MIFHKPWASNSLLKGSRGKVPQVSADCPVNPSFFVLWISLHLDSHPLFTLTPLLLLAVPVLSSYFPGKPQHAPLSSAPGALPTQSHFVYSILLQVWWWSKEVTSQERRQGKLNVRQHVGGIHHPPLEGSDSAPPSMGLAMFHSLSSSST